MRALRHLTIFSALSALLVAVPTAASAAQVSVQLQFGQSAARAAYDEGFQRGERAGIEDAQRGQRFQFTDESDYRRGDVGFQSRYGNRDRYREEFRRGFEVGYGSGFARVTDQWGNYGGPRVTPGYNTGYGYQRYDLASTNGYDDGYQEGLKDGRDRNAFDPVRESRYRSGDHGYRSAYGPRDIYKARYRDAFQQGYERGFADARRY